MKTILFIDGRNFLDKIKSVKKDVDFSVYDFGGLIDKVLLGVKVDKKVFYFGKLSEHPETLEK